MEPDNHSPGMLIARLDRIPIWSLPGLFIGIIGVGFLFTFYDIFDINVSFIQTCAPRLFRAAHRPRRRTISACRSSLISSATSSAP